MLLVGLACSDLDQSELPEDVELGVEIDWDIVTVATSEQDLPVFPGVAGGYFMRLWLDGEMRTACVTPDGDLACTAEVLVRRVDDGTEIADAILMPHESDAVDSGQHWQLLVMVPMNLWAIADRLEDAYGQVAQVEVVVTRDGSDVGPIVMTGPLVEVDFPF